MPVTGGSLIVSLGSYSAAQCSTVLYLTSRLQVKWPAEQGKRSGSQILETL